VTKKSFLKVNKKIFNQDVDLNLKNLNYITKLLKKSKFETFSLNRIDLLPDKQINWISEIINNNSQLKTINFESKKKTFSHSKGVSNFNFTNLFTSLKSKNLQNLILFSIVLLF
jgi:hypothetical protein